jgi:hypothetical protein
LSKSSGQRKLDRGIEQANGLYEEVRAYEASRAYELNTTRQRRSAEEVFCVSLAVEREPPSDEWPLVLGEIVHNLRSSLDHVIYAQARPQSTRTQFRIFIDQDEFQDKGLPRLHGVPAAVKATVESLQPFNVTPQAPRRDWLWVLHDLCNLDKHRTLTTVATAVGVPYIGYEGPNTTTLVTDWVDPSEPLRDRTRVVSFTVAGPGAEDVATEPGFSYHVTVEGLPLRVTLGKIVQAAFEAVHRCETGKALSDESFFNVWLPLWRTTDK